MRSVEVSEEDVLPRLGLAQTHTAFAHPTKKPTGELDLLRKHFLRCLYSLKWRMVNVVFELARRPARGF